MIRFASYVCQAALLIAVVASSASAQQSVASLPPRYDTSASAAILSRPVTVNLQRVSLRRAIDAIATSAHIAVQYRESVLIPYKTPVTIRAVNNPLRDVLDQALNGTQLMVRVLPGDRLGIEAALTDVPHAESATITGHVTDRTSRVALADALVTVAGTTTGVRTDVDGRYRLVTSRDGAIRVRAQRLGYTPVTKTVTVVAGQTATLDFDLEAGTVRLDSVITTATGNQSRRSFGNVVATIDAPHIVAVAPVTNINEMLQARASGVQIIQNSGQTGGASYIRIRGMSSLSLSEEPLVIVDGVRYESGDVPGNFGTQNIRRLTEINPEEIESINIIKGPSAAALYGTQAANGVLVIKTKRGKAGPPTWSAFAEGGMVQQPSHFEPNWHSWGHQLDASRQPVGEPIWCSIAAPSNGECAVDSLTTNNPYTAPLTRPFGTTPRYEGGLQVTGGADLLQYFVSATWQHEIGPFVMPSFERNRLTQERGAPPPDEQIHPNQLRQASVRGNFTFDVGRNARLDLNTGYINHDLSNTFDGAYYAGLTDQLSRGPGYLNSTNGTQREFVGDIFSVEQRTTDKRFTGSAALDWTPSEWLGLRAVTGIDEVSAYNYSMNRYGEGPRIAYAWGPPPFAGGKLFERSDNLLYSVDLGATATKLLTPTLTSKTSLGAQWHKRGLYEGQGQGFDFGVPGVTTPNSAADRLASEFTTENASYGAYLEEQVSHRDRLFVTAGLRTDENSAFGRSAVTTIYPRTSISYVISDEGWFPHMLSMNRLRLRGAWGKAGVQPYTIAALQYLSATTYPIDGQNTPAIRLASLGNAKLKPEVTTEIEVGADMGFFNDRLGIEATFFNKRSKDALYKRPLPPSYGASIGSEEPSQWQNLAAVQNRGVELAVDAQLVDTRLLAWTFHVNGSHLMNKLLDAGDVSLPTTPGARNVVGYPLFGLWDKPILSYSDANGDGILTENEIVVGTKDAFRGSTLPTWEAGISNTFGFFSNRVRISALFDYRGGFYNEWGYQTARCVFIGNCRAVNDPTTPLADQAAAVMGGSSTNTTYWGFFVPNDFIRFRELSISYALPEGFGRRFLRSRSATLALSARNLGVLWTKFPGLDPEINSDINENTGGNNGASTEPPLRYFIVRLNIAF